MNSDHLRLLREAAFAAVSLVLLALPGCSGSKEGPIRASVTGTVTFDGKPLEKGTIRFVPLDGAGGPKTSTSIEAGTFILPAEAGPTMGEHRVEIEAPQAGNLAMDDEEAMLRLEAEGKRQRPDFPIIPTVYNARSTLKKSQRVHQMMQYIQGKDVGPWLSLVEPNIIC